MMFFSIFERGFFMAVYQLSANNFLGIDKSNSFLYVIKVKLPVFIKVNDGLKEKTEGTFQNLKDIEQLDIKFHEGKFTRFKLWLNFSDYNDSQSDFSVNLMFHPELMEIRKYSLHVGQQFHVETTPQDDNISLDDLEKDFEKFQKINLFVGAQYQHTGVRNQ